MNDDGALAHVAGAYYCPHCVAMPLYYSRLHGWERTFALLSPFKPFRCHRCAWRGWKVDVKWRRWFRLKPPS